MRLLQGSSRLLFSALHKSGGAHDCGEAVVRCVENQEPRAPRTWIAEAVRRPRGDSDDGSGPDSATARFAEEVDLAFEDEHRVDVVVGVWRHFEG